MRKIFPLTALALVVLAATAQAAPRSLRMASAGDILTFDPHAHNETINNTAASYVYEGLTAFDLQMRVVPRLATSWRYDEASSSWIFDIRRGVTFHEGQELTARDCAFSLDRARSQTSSMRSMTAGILDVKALDSHTLAIRTASASPIILRQLTGLMVMSEAWCREHGALQTQSLKGSGAESWVSRHANGTGPFRVASRQADVKTVFAANRQWWNEARRRGNLDTLVFRPISSAATRTAALVSGEIDFVLDPPPQDIARLARLPELTVQKSAGNRVIMLQFDQASERPKYLSRPAGKNPFRDIRVRRALYQAIDIEAIRMQTMRGASSPTGLLAASSMEGWSQDLDTRLPYDPKAAARLLAQAGYRPGDIAFTLDCPNNHYANDEAICKAIVAMWAKIGVQASANAMPRATFFPKVHQRDTSACMLGYGSPSFDALHCLQATMATRDSATGNGAVNDGGYSNPKLDALIEASKRESDIDRRLAIAREALALVRDDISAIPLHVQSSFWAMKKGLDIPHRPDNRPVADWIRVPDRW